MICRFAVRQVFFMRSIMVFVAGGSHEHVENAAWELPMPRLIFAVTSVWLGFWRLCGFSREFRLLHVIVGNLPLEGLQEGDD